MTSFKSCYTEPGASICLCIRWRSLVLPSPSCVQLFATLWTAARQASPSITNSRSPPKPTSMELVMPSNHLILCRPLLLPPSVFPSIRVSSNESALRIRWPKDWSFSFNTSPSNERPGLISFRRTGWISLQSEGLSSPPQHHSSKASVLRCSDWDGLQDENLGLCEDGPAGLSSLLPEPIFSSAPTSPWKRRRWAGRSPLHPAPWQYSGPHESSPPSRTTQIACLLQPRNPP